MLAAVSCWPVNLALISGGVVSKMTDQKRDFDNPISDGLLIIITQIKDIWKSDIIIISKIFSIIIMCIVFILLAVVWPYGILIQFMKIMGYLIIDTSSKIKNEDVFKSIPLMIIVGIYGIIWIIVAVLSLPLIIIGLIFYTTKRAFSG